MPAAALSGSDTCLYLLYIPGAGGRAVSRRSRVNQAIAREAIAAELDRDALARVAAFRYVTTAAATREQHLGSPDAGERPGAGELASRSLSAYLAYRLEPGHDQEAAAAFSGFADVAFEYTVLSNIHAGGLPAAEAASVIVARVLDMLEHRAAGNRLESLVAAGWHRLYSGSWSMETSGMESRPGIRNELVPDILDDLCCKLGWR